jgi:hypothetical protein
MKTHGEVEMSGRLHAPAALPHGIELLVPIGYETVSASETVWTLSRPYRESNPSRPARSPSLYRLS